MDDSPQPPGATPEDDLLRDLQRVAGLADPCPAEVTAAARAAFALRTLDAELAELVADSWAQDSVGVRGGPPGEQPRLLSFTAAAAGGASEAVELDLEVVPGPRPLVLGQALGAAVTEVVLEQPGGPVVAVPDALGRFRARVAAGRLRVRLRHAGGLVVTSWVTI